MDSLQQDFLSDGSVRWWNNYKSLIFILDDSGDQFVNLMYKKPIPVDSTNSKSQS